MVRPAARPHGHTPSPKGAVRAFTWIVTPTSPRTGSPARAREWNTGLPSGSVAMIGTDGIGHSLAAVGPNGRAALQMGQRVVDDLRWCVCLLGGPIPGQPETATRGAPPDWGGRVRRLPLPPADGTPSALLRPAPFREHSNRLPGTRTTCEGNRPVRTLALCCRRAGWGPMSAPGSWRCRTATPVPCPASIGGRWTAKARWCAPPSAAVRAATSPAPSSRAP